MRVALIERDSPLHLRGLRRESTNDTTWRTTVGGVEQYRAAYDIHTDHPLGARPSYHDMNRADQYRQLEHSIDQLTPTHARDREIDLGIER